jgi:hypothetical protein
MLGRILFINLLKVQTACGHGKSKWPCSDGRFKLQTNVGQLLEMVTIPSQLYTQVYIHFPGRGGKLKQYITRDSRTFGAESPQRISSVKEP